MNFQNNDKQRFIFEHMTTESTSLWPISCHFWFLYMYQHIYANEHNTHDKSAYLYIYGPYIGTASKWLHSSFSFFSQSHRPIILVAVCNKILLKNSDGITLNKDTK